MSKSYVSMVQCITCGGDVNALLLDRRLKDSFDSKTVTGELCDTCTERAKEYTFLLEAKPAANGYSLSGRSAQLKKDSEIHKDLLKEGDAGRGYVFVDKELLDSLEELYKKSMAEQESSVDA